MYLDIRLMLAALRGESLLQIALSRAQPDPWAAIEEWHLLHAAITKPASYSPPTARGEPARGHVQRDSGKPADLEILQDAAACTMADMLILRRQVDVTACLACSLIARDYGFAWSTLEDIGRTPEATIDEILDMHVTGTARAAAKELFHATLNWNRRWRFNPDFVPTFVSDSGRIRRLSLDDMD